MRNDGRDNLLGALLIAGQFVIPEVRKWRRDVPEGIHEMIADSSRSVSGQPRRGKARNRYIHQVGECRSHVGLEQG